MTDAKVNIGRVPAGAGAERDESARRTKAGGRRLALLTSLEDDRALQRLARLFGDGARVYRTLEDLARHADEPTLLAFSTSLIVPDDLLGRFPAGAYNLHAASPDYPGRDPHHWAIYDGADHYGATLHVMTKRVDDGPIIETETFAVRADETPYTLLERANEAAFRLLERNAENLLSGRPLAPQMARKWTGRKHSRQQFLQMCRLDPQMSREEFERRLRAFGGGPYNNLSVTLHGRTFRLERD